MTFNVTGHTLNAILNQRSQDMLTANNWNVVQYALLTHMMAQVSGLEAGELVHVIADCHIYDRHIPAVKAMLDREGYPALPCGWIRASRTSTPSPRTVLPWRDISTIPLILRFPWPSKEADHESHCCGI